MAKKALIGMTLAELKELVAELKMPAFKAGQIARRIYQHRAADIDEFTELSKDERRRLAAVAETGREAPTAEAISADGTAKYLFRGAGGRSIESVMIPDRDRATLCVSSQAGCRMNCKFCMTGRGGFQGNLTSAQIINQVLSVPESDRLTNIVFMGMGEPLDNFDEVARAIEILTAPWGLAWSPRRITVSTVGKGDRLSRLLEETKVHVALSVHNPFASARAAIMPVEKAWPLPDVLKKIRQADSWTGQRRFSVEYIMWRGVNDDLRHADALSRMLHDIPCRVNLIRFHAFPGYDGAPATKADMEAFRDRLNDRGITATIRASRGEDIDAACGMLAGKKNQGEEQQKKD